MTIYPNAICPDVWSVLPFLGAHTNRIKLSSGVTDPLRRHPATVAQTVATLDQLTHGRAVLGLGAGEAMNLSPFGIKHHAPLQRLREAITCIHLLWGASPHNPATFQGCFYELHEAFLQIQPKQQPHPPIYLGALGPKTRELTGVLADGWYPWISPISLYASWIKDINRGVKQAERSLLEIDTVARVYLALAEDFEEAVNAVEKTAKTALLLEKRALQQLGYTPSSMVGSIQSIIPDRNFQLFQKCLERALDEIELEAIFEVSIVGTLETCIRRIERYLRAGAKHFVIYNLSPDTKRTFELFQTTIIPYFKDTLREE
jgi:alkanesulfonate monooxygenase SsuD/methylene tetrahydromethanopterin reductase-like flavin-dependent oxidoreductase (luciferase family)